MSTSFPSIRLGDWRVKGFRVEGLGCKCSFSGYCQDFVGFRACNVSGLILYCRGLGAWKWVPSKVSLKGATRDLANAGYY